MINTLVVIYLLSTDASEWGGWRYVVIHYIDFTATHIPFPVRVIPRTVFKPRTSIDT